MNSTTDIDESCFIIADSSDDALKSSKNGLMENCVMDTIYIIQFLK